MSVSGDAGKSTHEKVLSPVQEPLSEKEDEKPTDTQEIVSGSRERRPTDKGKQMREEVSKRLLKAFIRAYESWKKIARESRTRLKKFCSKEDLNKMYDEIQSGYDRLTQNYEPLQRRAGRYGKKLYFDFFPPKISDFDFISRYEQNHNFCIISFYFLVKKKM